MGHTAATMVPIVSLAESDALHTEQARVPLLKFSKQRAIKDPLASSRSKKQRNSHNASASPAFKGYKPFR